MNANTYKLGPASEVTRERPTVADLQRAQLHALRRGDRRRAAAYAAVVRRRVELAQRAAGRAASEQAAPRAA